MRALVTKKMLQTLLSIAMLFSCSKFVLLGILVAFYSFLCIDQVPAALI